MATITIDVLNFNLSVQGRGPIRNAWGVAYDDPLSMCGSFSFNVACRDPKAKLLITQQSVVRIYADGQEVFLGIVESKKRVIPANGAAYFEISGRSFLAETEDTGVGFLALRDGDVGTIDGPATVLATNGGGSWTLDTFYGQAQTAGTYYGRFVGETRLGALSKLAERTGEHFIYRPQLSGSSRKVIWLGAAGAPSGVRAIQGGGAGMGPESNPRICLINSFEELEDGIDITNRIRVFGAGDDLEHSALTLAASSYTGIVGDFEVNRLYSIIEYKHAITTLGYRPRTRYVQFEDIAPISNTLADLQVAADMLAEAGFRYLIRYGLPHKFYKLSVTKLPATVRPGQSIRVIYYEEDGPGEVIHDVDMDLIILNIATRYGNNGDVHYDLTVATTDRFPASTQDENAVRLEKARLYQTHTQRGAAIYPWSYIEDFDDTEAAELPFWLGKEICYVQQVLLRFKIEPLMSTVKSVGGTASTTGPVNGSTTTGASSSTTTAGGSTHSHTVTIPAHTHTIPNHQHAIGASQGSGGRNLGVFTGSAAVYYEGTDVGTLSILTTASSGATTSASGGGSTQTSSAEGSHTHEMAHTHEFPHVHEFSSVITAEYGIYRETDSAKIIRTDNVSNLTTDMALTVNGDAPPGGAIQPAGVAGYWEIDLTNDVINVAGGTFQPNQMINTIAFIAASGKTGRVKAQLLIRASIQAVANF